MSPEMQALTKQAVEEAYDLGVSACIRAVEGMADIWAKGPRPLSLFTRPADIKAYAARSIAASLQRLRDGPPTMPANRIEKEGSTDNGAGT